MRFFNYLMILCLTLILSGCDFSNNNEYRSDVNGYLDSYIEEYGIIEVFSVQNFTSDLVYETFLLGDYYSENTVDLVYGQDVEGNDLLLVIPNSTVDDLVIANSPFPDKQDIVDFALVFNEDEYSISIIEDSFSFFARAEIFSNYSGLGYNRFESVYDMNELIPLTTNSLFLLVGIIETEDSDNLEVYLINDIDDEFVYIVIGGNGFSFLD